MMYAIESTKIRITYDEPVVAAGLAAVLGRQPDMQLLDHSSSPLGPGVWRAQDEADVVVSDYDAGLVYLANARSAEPPRSARRPKVMLFAQSAGEVEVRCALEAGVYGYVLQGCSLDELVHAVRTLKRGMRYFCEPISERIADSLTGVTLTRREEEVLTLLTTGCCNKTIAKTLSIAVNTAKTHVRRVLEKLDATSRSEAVAVARRRGLVPTRHPQESHRVAHRERAAAGGDVWSMTELAA